MIIEEISENNLIKQIYEKYNEKVILNILDKSQKYQFINWYVFIFVVLASIFIFCNLIVEIKFSIPLSAVICIIFNILGFNLCRTKIYFENNTLIVKRVFKKEFDLQRYPRLYTYCKFHRANSTGSFSTISYTSYFLNISQNEKEINLRLYSSNAKKIAMFLNNLELTYLYKLSEEQKNLSATKTELILNRFLNVSAPSKIIAIKSSDKKIVFRNEQFFYLFIIATFIIPIIIFTIITIKNMLHASQNPTIIIIFAAIIIFLLLLVLLYLYLKCTLRIRFKTNSTLRVNGKKFNLADDTVKLKFLNYSKTNTFNDNDMSLSYISHPEAGTNGILLRGFKIIICDSKNDVGFIFKKVNAENLQYFIDNLYLE